MSMPLNRVYWIIDDLEIHQTTLKSLIRDKEKMLTTVRESHRIITDLEGAPSGGTQQQSCIEFALQEELNRLHFQLDELLALVAKLNALKTRTCATCKGIHSVTYSADGRDQTTPVTTICPDCKGVSISAKPSYTPQPNGC